MTIENLFFFKRFKPHRVCKNNRRCLCESHHMTDLPFPGRRQALLAVRENNHNVVVSLANQPAWQKRKPFQASGRGWYGNAT